MPRPPCPRRISHRPPADYFKPAGIPLYDLQEIELAADELEAVRLADDADLYNTEAAIRMGVSRQTFDRIVGRARRKIAAALVHGHALRILRPAGSRAAAGDNPGRKRRAGRNEAGAGKPGAR
ncbi:MAG: DUF134 domain-containing protein [Opitutaceae bacterium]|nr:DUF134 domain-containing protein [Opitutaceae bacterium]